MLTWFLILWSFIVIALLGLLYMTIVSYKRNRPRLKVFSIWTISFFVLLLGVSQFGKTHWYRDAQIQEQLEDKHHLQQISHFAEKEAIEEVAVMTKPLDLEVERVQHTKGSSHLKMIAEINGVPYELTVSSKPLLLPVFREWNVQSIESGF